ncbi:hypothetical protein BVRB_1g008350 [Beta vulgaris subsp. vulgaris]|nr:hypothetical protein BVRB_1g008350 [Beta vulgaris subsp. vulgaris]
MTWAVGKRRRGEGGFLGAESILKQIADGPSRRRVGFISSGPPARGHSEIHNEKGENIGEITTGRFSTYLKKNIAMGYVKSGNHKAGTNVNIVVRGKPYGGVITKMPAVEANVVQAKPKSVYRHAKANVHMKSGGFQNSAPKFGKKKDMGIVFKDPVVKKVSPAIAPVHGKGKGKALVFASAPQYGSLSDSDDDTVLEAFPPILPSSGAFQAAVIDFSSKEAGEGVGCDLAPPIAADIELSPIPLQVVYPGEFFDGNQFGPLVHLAEQQFGGYSMFESDVENDTMILHNEDRTCDDIPANHDSPFHSIDSASSIVRHISSLGVEQDPPMEPTSLSSASKRRKGNSEDDSASSGLKRYKA